MGKPLRVYNTSDLREMSDAEIKGRIVPLILAKFASDSSASERGNLHLHTGNNQTGTVGNFYNRSRTRNVGEHSDSSIQTMSQAAFCVTQRSNAETSSPTWPVNWEGSGVLSEMNSTKLKTDILRCCAEVYRQTGTSTGVGSYYFGTSAPSLGGTWEGSHTQDSYDDDDLTGNLQTAVADTFKTSSGLQSVNYYLWRKTASGTALSSGNEYVPCTTATVSSVTGNIKQMTDVEVESLVNEWRNFIMADQGTIGSTTVGTIGSYQLTTSSTAPSGGTWTQMGGFNDKLADIQSLQYSFQYQSYSQHTMFTTNYQLNYGDYQGHRYNNMYTQNWVRHFDELMYTQQFAGQTIMNTQSTDNYYLWRRIG